MRLPAGIAATCLLDTRNNGHRVTSTPGDLPSSYPMASPTNLTNTNETVMPRVRIISTGSEILHGLYPDTNAQHISRLLFERGFRVISHAAAPDHPALLRDTLRGALTQCELIVITGGLGPTEDDVNRDIIADIYASTLRPDPKAERMMRKRFASRGIPMPERNVVQAMLPADAQPLYNHWGTAPGFLLPPRDGNPALLALPGPPSEWQPMLRRALDRHIPRLFPNPLQRAVHTIHLAMVPESLVNEALADLFVQSPDRELTILASQGHIRVRIIATGSTPEDTAAIISPMHHEIIDRLGPEAIFADGPEEITLAAAVLRDLQERGKTLALAESCTGGWIAKALTDIPGSSATFLAGWVTYSNDAKVRDLSVPLQLIEQHGAVSEEVVRAMADGARRRAGTDYALSVSGVAGPDGGTPDKPVGTVWFGIATPEGTLARKRLFRGNRESVRGWSVQQALELLRRVIHGGDPDALLTGSVRSKVDPGKT